MSNIKRIKIEKPESCDEIIAALRHALEIAHDVPLESITIDLRISHNTGCTLTASQPVG